MGAHGDADSQPVRITCTRRAQQTYDVTLNRRPRVGDATQSGSVTDALRRVQDRRNRTLASQRENANKPLPAATGDCVTSQVLRRVVRESLDESRGRRLTHRPQGEGDTLPRSKPVRSTYYEECDAQLLTCEPDGPLCAATLTSARSKLIQFLQTEEFFDEHSFIALMALILGHMFRLLVAIFAMAYTAHSVLGVLVYVWRFMKVRAADIVTTYGGPQAAYKCAVFCAELLAIFFCILVFSWVIFVPACCLIAVTASNTLHLFI